MDKARIEKLLEERLAAEDLFVVEVVVVPDKSITVYLDGNQTNVSVKQCATTTRFLRDELGESADAYGITVSSPDLDKPFRHRNQYIKNIDKNVEVTLNDGKKIEGKLVAVEEDGSLRVQEFLPKKGNNKSLKPTLGETISEIPFQTIKQTKKLVFI